MVAEDEYEDDGSGSGGAESCGDERADSVVGVEAVRPAAKELLTVAVDEEDEDDKDSERDAGA